MACLSVIAFLLFSKKYLRLRNPSSPDHPPSLPPQVSQAAVFLIVVSGQPALEPLSDVDNYPNSWLLELQTLRFSYAT